LIAFGITMFVAWGRATEANERLRGTVGMVSNVLGAADAENVDQPLAASSMGEMMQKWLYVVDADLTDYPMIAAAVRLDLAQNHIGNGRWNDAKDAIDRAAKSIELSTDSPSPTAGRLLHLRGRLRYKEADYARAVADYRASLLHRQATDPGSEETATTMHHLGASLQGLGKADESDRVLNAALHRHRELVSSARGDTDVIRRRVALSNLLNSMAVGHVVNRPEQALPLLREAVVLVEVDSADPQADWRIAALRHNIGNCLARLGQLEAAETSLTEALRIKELQGNPVSIANTEAALARLGVLQGDSTAGRAHLVRAHTLRGDLLPAGHPSHRDERLIEIELLLMDGELNHAATNLDIARKASNSMTAGAAIKRLDALLAEARGNIDIAEVLMGEAMQTFANVAGAQSPEARKCLATMARLAEKRGDPTTAAQLADRARPPAEVSGGGGDASQ
jgi:tetratricopeptide (TPR) repeat protein